MDKYETFKNALDVLCIDSLFKRRDKLILAFGRKSLTLDQTKETLPLNDNMNTLKFWNRNKYRVRKGNTERFKNSTIPYIQRILNAN